MADDKNDEDDILPSEPSAVDYIEERNFLLRDVPYDVVRQAWFAQSFLLVQDGAKVVDMGCGNGQLTYAMAVLNPHLRFIGVDRSKKVIREAIKTYQLHNLEYKIGDVSGEMFDHDSIDAIINSYTLHQVFSEARYNEKIVSDTLSKQFSMLKDDGILFIRDYAKPVKDEFVLIEMHDKESKSEELKDLSEVDLLIWFSENAQPKQDPGCGGFFLEELPPRFPKTRLFRLPYRWAYEFIMRKDNREIWQDQLPYEYTFYTVDDFRRELGLLGARMHYSAPHWDESYIRNNFEGHFRLLNLEGETIGDPATSFIAVARKLPERSSLSVQERRIDEDDEGELTVRTMRDTKNGELVDVVSRGREMAEILPYRIDENGKLYVYFHDGVVRGITNSVSRSGANIDGRKWSGHMLEALATDFTTVSELGELNASNTKQFAKSYIGLKPEDGAILDAGSFYYPDPNYIEERVHTYFLKVQEQPKTIPPKRKILENQHFQAKGVIREYSAQRILDSIAVGLIPNARLELQILSLMQHLNVKAENWISKDISIAVGEITKFFDVKKYLKKVKHSEKRFKEAKGSAGQLRTVTSIFVEEGQSQGGPKGIASEHLDFVLSDEQTINTATVLPITSSARKDLHAGIVTKNMPIIQRFEGQSLNVTVPQYNIPKEIVNYRMLKQFIAEKFGVTPDMVIKLGESYYSHIGITPQRIHPFAVAAPPTLIKDPKIKFMPFYQYRLLWKSLSRDEALMTSIARAYRYLPSHIKLEAKRDVYMMLEKVFQASQPDFSLPDAVESSLRIREFQSEYEEFDDDDNRKKKSKKRKGKKDKDDKKKKDRRRKRKIGLRDGNDVKDGSELNEDLDDAESLEEQNAEAKKALERSLINEFKHEIDEIRKALEENDDLDKPKPE